MASGASPNIVYLRWSPREQEFDGDHLFGDSTYELQHAAVAENLHEMLPNPVTAAVL